jgi:osmotically-inducible protein OsmY
MPDNVRIENDILEALADDPRLPAPGEIAVQAFDGAVTLRGTVGSFAQRRAAEKDANGVKGVLVVDNELQVRLIDESAREDAEIRGAALQTLMWDSELPVGAIDVKVTDGWVTLDGYVNHQHQSDAAFEDVSKLFGIYGIINKITVSEELT